MAYPDTIATIALVVSLLTAAWTGWRNWRWDRPVISVSGEQMIKTRDYYDAKGGRANFTVDVVNRGNQATQVTAAYWEIDRGNGLQIRFAAGPGGGGVESLFEGDEERNAPSFPFTLERYQRRTWEFDIETRGMLEKEGILRCRPVVEFVSRKSIEHAYGEWEPSQIAIQAKIARENAAENGLAEP
ncbi:hypothetical protein [Leucobacter sp. NPDC077196]|uniref:hypothetical protein n=1 Tax=Leucobacter sp. NPDC077196 TaxID=3154959 RepID=UPI003436987D